jgi:hypothetical protein
MQKNNFYAHYISDSETTHDDTLSESENDNLINFHSLSISKASNKKVNKNNGNLRSIF